MRGPDLDREPNDVLIRSDLQKFLRKRYAADNITTGEIDSIIRQLDALNAADLYGSNKTVCKWVSDGFLLKREDRNRKDLYIQLIDYGGSGLSRMDTLVRPKVSDRARVPNLQVTTVAEKPSGYQLNNDDADPNLSLIHISEPTRPY